MPCIRSDKLSSTLVKGKKLLASDQRYKASFYRLRKSSLLIRACFASACSSQVEKQSISVAPSGFIIALQSKAASVISGCSFPLRYLENIDA
ncbi:hypothetical protein FGO68_gene7479 [Halteria grandinella]|uniref:Uncharacterized protein n=1 Tax=Halteria grandinella TaxID=5974 RepID=A0A8J8P1M4_HALGN|nr:hypothetical protein FGO68_gene7479 [Halteria grandinella]